MSNKANVIIIDGPERVCLYTHWGRDQLPSQLRAALVRGKDRWTDAPYLARIIFCEMIQKDVLGELGYGISSYAGDDRDPAIVVDCDAQTVTFPNRPPVSIADFATGNLDW
jgi:hypothetical protein